MVAYPIPSQLVNRSTVRSGELTPDVNLHRRRTVRSCSIDCRLCSPEVYRGIPHRRDVTGSATWPLGLTSKRRSSGFSPYVVVGK